MHRARATGRAQPDQPGRQSGARIAHPHKPPPGRGTAHSATVLAVRTGWVCSDDSCSSALGPPPRSKPPSTTARLRTLSHRSLRVVCLQVSQRSWCITVAHCATTTRRAAQSAATGTSQPASMPAVLRPPPDAVRQGRNTPVDVKLYNSEREMFLISRTPVSTVAAAPASLLACSAA